MANDRVIPNAKGGGGLADLPPAGDQRRDVLAERKDQLEEQAAGLNEMGGTVREDVFRDIDSEIGSAFNEMDPPHKRPDYRYKWVYRDQHSRNGMHAFTHARAQGWEPVRHNDPDGKDMSHCVTTAEGFLVVGDTILMRVPMGWYIALRRAERDLNIRRDAAVIPPEMAEVAFKHRGGQAASHGLDKPEIIAVQERWNANMTRAANLAMQLKQEQQQLDQMIRTGTVGRAPGRQR